MGGAAPGSRLQDRSTAPGVHRTDEVGLHPDGRALSGASPGGSEPRHYWAGGRVLRADDPEVPRTLLERPGCYTTARVRGGSVRFVADHARRLIRDALALDIGRPSTAEIEIAFEALGRAEFGEGEGIVRLAAVRDASGQLQLIGTPRPIGLEPDTWRAATAPAVHPGPGPGSGTKRTHQPVYLATHAFCRERGLDEALLFDRAGRLVEGGRSNLLLETRSGDLLYPTPALGAVRGLALERIGRKLPELRASEIRSEHIRSGRALLAINAVRGVRPIVELDDLPVGDGDSVPAIARRLASLLE